MSNAAPMSAAESAANKVRELAASIYVDLCSSAVSIDENAVKMTASAENLAKLSFKLSLAFIKVEQEVNSDHLPKNVNFKLSDSAIAEWSK